MKGLDLAKKYWEEVGRPAFLEACPEILDCAAIGLAGEGSECFGYDDEISRDHDWGPGFCIWLTKENFEKYGRKAASVYQSLPETFLGYRRLRVSEMTEGRVGVLEIDDFFRKFLGTAELPQTVLDWRRLPEEGLTMVTNGAVFLDTDGEFTRRREALSAYYPEDLRLKKLARSLALAGQSGQYNYYRIMRRGDQVAANIALTEYIRLVQSAVFQLNRKYKPYYKWSQRALRDLPLLGREISTRLEALVAGPPPHAETIEDIASILIDELRREELTDSDSDFLTDHAFRVQSHISDPVLAGMHVMAE
ncbi:MAG: DUF4037 domain-containing protein [Anaerovoracaceae bacterium]|jgi:hypothetical protein